jgi:hypothetical protein
MDSKEMDNYTKITKANLEERFGMDTDGNFGHVSDFIMDDANWQIKYLVADTHTWFDRKKFLIETGTIKEIQSGNSQVILDISTNSLKDCPDFDQSQFNHSRIARTPFVTS